jgi:arylsulfatase A-like enzyme
MSKHLKRLLLTMLLALYLSTGSTLAEAQDRTKQYNIVLIMTDQQSIDALSIAGNPYLKTPALDRLAGRGMRFSNSYCTYPLCSPSRASIFTSRMPHEVGVNSNEKAILPQVPTMGSLLRSAGYETAYAGKWHLPDSFPYNATKPENMVIPGFDVLPLNPEYKQTKKYTAKGLSLDGGTAEASVKFIKARHSKPFLLVCSILNPHDICSYPEHPAEFNPLHSGPLPPVVANFNATTKEPEILVNRRQKNKPIIGWSELQWQQYRAAYYRLTEIADGLIGKVLTALTEAGLAENTIVIFTADHGEALGAHHFIHKMLFYEESVAVPFILSVPGVTRQAAVDSKHLVSGLDVLPTICDYAGVKPDTSFEGRSLRPLVAGGNTPWRSVLFGEVGTNQQRARMVRTERYKYIVYEKGANPEQLFDRQTDPGETRNLVSDPSAKTILETHRRLLMEHLQKTKDDFVVPFMTK